MDVKKPIFIVGTGRSGSTAFHRVMARHPEIAFLSAFLEKYPDRLYLNSWLMRILDLPVLNWLGGRILPSECWNFWERHGIAGICRDPVAEDVTPARKKMLREILPRFLTGRRRRLLIKLTGWSRIGYFREVFPDARFIHIVRDGRAVANSLLNVGWWQGWMGPDNWGFGPLPGNYRDEWEKHNRSFVSLAGIEWKLLMDSYREAATGLEPSEYLEIRYEDLCSDPMETFRVFCSFCELTFPETFRSAISSSPAFENRNFKWREQLSESQQGVLSEVLTKHLQMYGYED